MSIADFSNTKFSKVLTNYSIILFLIVALSIGIRLYFFPSNVPLSSDALYYFWYSSDIFRIGELPLEWTPNNNGWPIFVSIFFSIFDTDDIFALMQIQRLLSLIISSMVSIPVYFICKKFVDRKFALVGASLIAFDPRLLVNSLLGVTDPSYLLLITTSLALFLSNNKKFIYISFVLVSFATIVRAEGLTFFLVLSVLFFFKYKKENYKKFGKYLILLGIFTLIILPIGHYRNEVQGTDGIFLNNISSGAVIISSTENLDARNSLIQGGELFLKYLIWVLIPNFIIFMPLGIFLILKNRNFEKNTIILSLCIMALPAWSAYNSGILETRYLYTLFPMFSVLAVLSIDKINEKIKKPNLLVFIIIVGILISSTLFYEKQKIDYEYEEEAFKVIEKISSMVSVTNILYQESSYFKTVQTIEEWPNRFTDMGLGTFKVNTISTTGFSNLEKFILESRGKELSHIIIDDKKERQDFLIDIFENENNYLYLKKIYDSKTDGFGYHLKVFEIDYEIFDSIVNKRE